MYVSKACLISGESKYNPKRFGIATTKIKASESLRIEPKLTMQPIATKIQNIILKKDEQFSLEAEKSKQLEKELKGQRRKTFLYKVGTYIGAGALLVLLGGK